MKDLELNQSQRRLLQIGVVLLLAIFIAGFFILKNQKPTAPAVKNTSVYIQNDKLYLFDQTLPEPHYPDHLIMHYPYLLLIHPQQNTSSIYNLIEKKENKNVNKILLDYDGTSALYNKGKTTYLNDQNLGALCQYGWIRSNQEVLCVTQIYTNYDANKLISINPLTKATKDVYISTDRLKVITALSVINGNVYLGEIYPYNNTSYLIINSQNPISVPTPINLIYQMNNEPYFASFKNTLNNTQKYYSINQDQISEQEYNKIYLVK